MNSYADEKALGSGEVKDRYKDKSKYVSMFDLADLLQQVGEKLDRIERKLETIRQNVQAQLPPRSAEESYQRAFKAAKDEARRDEMVQEIEHDSPPGPEAQSPSSVPRTGPIQRQPSPETPRLPDNPLDHMKRKR